MLFCAAAAVVLWHGARVTALWDITYTLEIAYRITLGQVPYRDFVVPQGPVTFLTHAAILELFDDGVFPHLGYCALVAGLTVWLTHHLVRQQFETLDDATASFVAFALTAPAVFLNGYSILPLPFYDPDCVLWVLAALVAIAWARRSGGAWRHLAAGALLAIPVFTKQNIGVAAFLTVHAFLLVSCAARHGERPGYAAFAAGSLAAMLLALAAIHGTAGIRPYFHWTVEYAASRRWPSADRIFWLYARPRTWVALGCAVAGFLVIARGRSRAAVVLGLAIAALPWVDAIRTMVRWGLAARAYALWGVAAGAAVLTWIAAVRTRDWRFERALPLVAIGIAHAAFASQGVHDSSYGVWPFLLIALAQPAAWMVHAAPPSRRRLVAIGVGGACLVFASLGYRHVTRHERLGFVDLVGTVAKATHPALRGLATPGSHLPDFERLLDRCAELIPAGDRVVLVPGEDPFFFASKRRPLFPVVVFDDTAAPYDGETVLRLLDSLDVEWVVVKNRLQLLNSPWRHLERFVALDLPARYVLVEELPRYRIFRRR